jgi:transcriptional regulator with XRE-family HTH domain
MHRLFPDAHRLGDMATKLRRLRTKRQMSQAELAAKARISRAYLIRLDPPLGALARLAKALGVPVTELPG